MLCSRRRACRALIMVKQNSIHTGHFPKSSPNDSLAGKYASVKRNNLFHIVIYRNFFHLENSVIYKHLYNNNLFKRNSHLIWHPYIIDQNHIFPKIWLFIYSLCCYGWFLFVHNLNTTNTNWLWFSYIFQQKINPEN
jgi:hypothetical protein